MVLNVGFTSGGWGKGEEAPYSFKMSRTEPATLQKGLRRLIEGAEKNGGF